MNTAQAAAALNTEPKILRRFLRADEHYANAGAGGRYDFEDVEITLLRERFQMWSNDKAAKAPVKARQRVERNDVATQRMSSTILGRKLYASERTRRDAIARARVDKLEAALIAAGLHISQMKERVR